MDPEARVDVLKALANTYRIEILELPSPEIRCRCHLRDQLGIALNLLSWEPAGYEAGDYAAFEITG